jgi:hypothetical protein
MAPDDIPRVRTWEDFSALGLDACDLVLVADCADPVPAFLAERLLPLRAAAAPTPSARTPAPRR